MNSKLTWAQPYRLKNVQYKLTASIVVLAVVLYFYSNFLDHIELRQGFSFNDPVLDLFHPVNLTWLIFTTIYLSLLAGIIILIKNPLKLTFAVQVYTLLILVRMIAMYTVPFNPPPSMIPLNDPFVQFFGTGKLLTKDLFFSGHTATVFMLFLVVDKKPYRQIFLVLTVVVGISVILQHVHYFIDVFAAPFFTSGCYLIVRYVRERFNFNAVS